MQQRANLGNSVVVQPTTFVTDQYEPIGAKGNFQEVFDSPADPNDTQLRIYNLMTWIGGYTLPAAEVTGRHLALLGKINWGIGACQFEADFDWKMGTQLSVAASFLRLSVAYSEVGAGVPANGVRVGGMLSSGSRAARSQVTRSYPQLIIVEGGEDNETVLFPVPPFAHALNLFANEQDFYEEGNVEIKYLGGASAGFSAPSTDLVSFASDGQPFFAGLSNEDGVRFPECARFVQVTALATDTTYHFTPCFTLSL